jgi:choline dehydrogenase-like flavoprotein
VLGGCGAVNGALMQRPQLGTFEGWPQGWSQQDLSPFLNLVEERLPHTATPSRDGKHYLEETGGNILKEALSLAGFLWLDDSSRPVAGAMGVPRVTARDGVRVSTASAILAPQLDRLELLTEASAEKILFHGGRATALHAKVRGTARTFRLTHGGIIVLTAGAYNTPRLLMSSGVGASSGPSALENSPAIENAHVGSGLSDKTITWQTYKIHHRRRHRGVKAFRFDPPSDQALDQYLSNQSGPLAQFGPTLAAFYRHQDRTEGFDVEMFVVPSSNTDEVKVEFVLMRPRCSRGWLSLHEGQIHQTGSLYMACDEDHEVLAGAVALVTRQMLSLGGSVVPSGGWPQGFAMNHYTGTCPLGDCVDSSTLLVRGTQNVAVADASLLPNQVWGHPAMTLMAVAFKAAGIFAERLQPAEIVV